MGDHHEDMCLYQPYYYGGSAGKVAHRLVLQAASTDLSDRGGDQPQICSGDSAEIFGHVWCGCAGEDPQDGNSL